jgi:hypothetical protein
MLHEHGEEARLAERMEKAISFSGPDPKYKNNKMYSKIYIIV